MTQDHLLLSLIIIFVGIGVMLPYMQQATDSDIEEFGLNEIDDDVRSSSANPVTFITILWSVIKMFFFTFGALPVWLDTILFLPLRIIAWIIIIDKVPFT